MSSYFCIIASPFFVWNLAVSEIAPGVTSEKKSGPPQDAREKKTVGGLPTSLTKKTRKVEQFPFFIYVLRGSRFTTILTSAFPEVDGVFCEFSYFDERRNPTAISQIAASSHILLLRKYSTCAPRLPTPNAKPVYLRGPRFYDTCVKPGLQTCEL